jgi:hypothetical protein
MRKLSKKKQNTRLCSVNFVENGALYETMWKNMDDADRPQTTIRAAQKSCRLQAG